MQLSSMTLNAKLNRQNNAKRFFRVKPSVGLVTDSQAVEPLISIGLDCEPAPNVDRFAGDRTLLDQEVATPLGVQP
jgi:hypothetical protein